MKSTQNEIKRTESDNLEAYNKSKDELEAKKLQIERDIETEAEQLKADDVYTEECAQRLEEARLSGEISVEKYEKEVAALKVEKEKIAAEKRNLETIRSGNEAMFAEDSAQLEQERAQQVLALNERKYAFKKDIQEWEKLVESEAVSVERTNSELQSELEAKQREVLNQTENLTEKEGNFDAENERIQTETQEVRSVM